MTSNVIQREAIQIFSSINDLILLPTQIDIFFLLNLDVLSHIFHFIGDKLYHLSQID